MPLQNLNVILAYPRFPENIGMTARACANMGCSELCLVKPERWNVERMRALATPKGEKLLNELKIYSSLEDALSGRNLAIASSARCGGWRKNILSPDKAAALVTNAIAGGEKVSLVFGPEDQGLANKDLILCQQIIHIKTSSGAKSLNLAQAVLLVLYECAKAMASLNTPVQPIKNERINLDDLKRLEKELKYILEQTGCLQGKNPDYYFLQWQTILGRAALTKHEYHTFMGFCRQIKHFLPIK